MKKFFTIIVILTLSFLLTSISDSVAWAAPGDSASNPIFISTANELDNIRYGLNKYYKLTNDINMHDFLCPT